MKKEYDFRAGERGKFYRPHAVLNIPVYLDREIQAYLSTAAEKRGVDLNTLVNDLLKKEISLVESIR